jgi:hypothetical protein
VRDPVHPQAGARPVLLHPLPDGLEPRARRRGRRARRRDRLVGDRDDRGGRAACRRRCLGPAPGGGRGGRGGVVGHPRRRDPGPLSPPRLRERAGHQGRAAAEDRGDPGGSSVRAQPARQVRRTGRVRPPRRRRRRRWRLGLAPAARARTRSARHAGAAVGAEPVPRLPGAARRARYRQDLRPLHGVPHAGRGPGRRRCPVPTAGPAVTSWQPPAGWPARLSEVDESALSSSAPASGQTPAVGVRSMA